MPTAAAPRIPLNTAQTTSAIRARRRGGRSVTAAHTATAAQASTNSASTAPAAKAPLDIARVGSPASDMLCRRTARPSTRL